MGGCAARTQPNDTSFNIREVHVRRRICLVGAALASSSLFAAVAMDSAAAAKPVKAKPAKPTIVTSNCASTMTTAIPAGATALTPPVLQGTDYGTVSCSGARFSNGVQSDWWTIPDSGDTVGSFRQYFNKGMIRGTFDLSPQPSDSVTQSNAAETDYTGTFTVTGGSGAFLGASGTGVAGCVSSDDVHTSCLIKLRLKVPPSTK
jgi:hypothetical protein